MTAAPQWRPPHWLVIAAAMIGIILAPIWMTVEVVGEGRWPVMTAAFIWFAWSGWGVLVVYASRISTGGGS